MYNLTFISLFFITLISCKEPSKSTKKETNNATQINVRVAKSNDTLKIHNLNSLPFDFEKYTAICLQQSLPECERKYPKINDISLKKVMDILGNRTEDNPTNIFQISNIYKNNIEIYVLDFEGDSTFQEVLTINNNQIISRQSIGHSMPEEKTYKSFVIEKDMIINIYMIDYQNLNKKIAEKYKIDATGKILKSKLN
ncbi:hypothetical protein [Epilithonimonas sp.]|uniref:hypothetical protein n=1 Tax=Epilithonimonas sp. TaxID=2894511 RepID=UPI002FDE5960